MPKKIAVSKVAEILQHNQLPPEQLRRIIEEINAVTNRQGEEKTKPGKKQFVILVSDPSLKISQDLVGWVLQIPDDAAPVTTQDRIFRAAYDFNASKRGRLLPVKTVGEAMENVAAKHFRDASVSVKTKTPVLVLRTDNKIPTDKVGAE